MEFYQIKPTFILSEIECPAVPYLYNATPSTYKKTYNTRVMYTCFYGYTFKDRTIAKTIRCDEKGTWYGAEKLGNCTGRFGL